MNVAVTNTATGEVATYEVSPAPSPQLPQHASAPVVCHAASSRHFLKHPSGPHYSKRNTVYKAPEVSGQDYAVIIGVCVTVFVLVVIFVSATLYYARKKTRPRLLLKRQ